MDEGTLIVTTLAASAAPGPKDAASSAVKDAYGKLTTVVTKQLATRRDGELALARHEEVPEAWKGLLLAELTAAGTANHQNLLAAAHGLMSLIDQTGSGLGNISFKYRNRRTCKSATITPRTITSELHRADDYWL